METTSIPAGRDSGWHIGMSQLSDLYAKQRREQDRSSRCERATGLLIHLALELLPMSEKNAIQSGKLVEMMRIQGYSDWSADYVRDVLLHCGHRSIRSRYRSGRYRVFWVVA